MQDFLAATAARAPDKVALVSGGRRSTYAQIESDATRLAHALAQRGVVRGDRVAILADNGPEFVVALFATLKAGAAFMPVSALARPERLLRLLDDSRAAALVTAQGLRGSWQGALARSKSVRTCVVAGLEGAGRDAREASYEAALAVPSPRASLPEAGDEDLAAIIYTSGSTGEPKGVMLTHANVVAAARSVNEYLGLVSDDVILCALPLSFSYGLYQVLMGFMVGATVVLERSFAFPVKVLETMARERVTVFPGVPTMFAMVIGIENLAAFDLRAVRMITSAAAALPERHIAELRARFPAAMLYSMYGLTECKRVSYLPPGELDRRPGSVGRGMPNQEAWLVDESGARLPNGSTGELVVRGKHVMRGYWEKPEATAACLKPAADGGTVLHTGDIFRSDADGYLYFVARKDDIIKRGGEKVSPREVENALAALEGVQEAAVVGVADEVLGQAVKAFVVLRPGFEYTERHLIRHCQACLEAFMVPREVAIVAELPKTESGKIRKTGLK